MSPAKIAVVIPVYNSAAHLEETVQSVQAQTLGAWELVIVDDGSTDDTIGVASRLAETDTRIRVVQAEHGGVSAARNLGVAAAGPQCRCLLFLDADDVLEPDALALLHAALDAEPAAVAANGLGRYVDEAGRPIRPGEMEAAGRARMRLVRDRTEPLDPSEPTTFDVLVYENCLLIGCVLVRRQAFEACGGFDARLSRCEDWDLWIRLSLLGPIRFVDRVVLHYRQHPGGASQSRRRMIEARLTLRRTTIRSARLSLEQRRLARQSWRAFQRNYCAARFGMFIRDLVGLRPGRAALHLAQTAAGCARLLRGWAW